VSDPDGIGDGHRFEPERTVPRASQRTTNVAYDARNRESEITRMVGRTGTDAILKEVDKCDIVCANCHRDRTKRRRDRGSTERE